MAEIRPFSGYLYKLKAPADLGRIIAPPYDMLGGDAIDRYYARDPRNAVRIIQNKKEPADAGNRDRHRRAAALFEQWVRDGAIVRDPKPSVYVYRQEFTIDGSRRARTGIIARVKLVDFSEGVVLPHENTLSAPKVDRMEHMQAINANTEQIFGIVQDGGDVYPAIADAAQHAEAIGACVDEFGVTHQLMRLSDANTISKLQQIIAPRTVLIADGHHRYETALAYARETGAPPAAFVMMTMVSMADPGLVIRPFHRMVRAQPGIMTPARELVARLFTILREETASADAARGFVQSPEDGSLLFLDAATSRLYRLSPNARGEAALKRESTLSDAWNHLNVSMVNLLFVKTLLGLPLNGETLHDQIAYEQDAATVTGTMAGSRDFIGAFFLRPITIQTIRAIVAAGERMPQKSTNFFPKIWSGLVFNRLEP
jgi:uncharacterized protein (DUF1015 family)